MFSWRCPKERIMAEPNPVPRRGSSDATLRFEFPDLLVSVLVGQVTAADMARIAAEARRFAAGRLHVLGLCDISRLGAPAHESRLVALEGFRNVPTRAIAFHGGGSRMRVMPSLVGAAVNLFSSRTQQCPMRFFASEAEARTWLSHRRDELRRELR